MGLPIRRDFARTIGDALLAHLYREAGGDGARSVRIEPYRAAVLLTGDARPARADVRHAGLVLHALLDNSTARFVVHTCPDVAGAFLIRPRGA